MKPLGNIKKFRAEVADLVKKAAAKSFFANRSMLGYEDSDSLDAQVCYDSMQISKAHQNELSETDWMDESRLLSWKTVNRTRPVKAFVLNPLHLRLALR